MFQTEHEFTLPIGRLRGIVMLTPQAWRVDPISGELLGGAASGVLWGSGSEAAGGKRGVQANPPYLVVILLSRVITRLDGVDPVTPQVIEGLYAADLAYLQDLYNSINQIDGDRRPVTCPECRHTFDLEAPSLGGLSATPSIA